MVDRKPTLDERVRAGLKVMLTGEAALAMTPDQARERHWIIRARCACGHRAFVSCYRLADQGLGTTPIGAIAPRLSCPNRCTTPPVIEIVDPYRSALDPD